MLDLALGPGDPPFERRGAHGTFPIAAWGIDGVVTWGIEAIMLAAGTNVQWLRDGVGLVGSAAETHEVAARCDSSDGVVFVPAPLGLGTPQWDYGRARRAVRADPRHGFARRSCARCSRAWRIAARISSRPRRRTPGSRSRRCASTAA
ncbi:MAG: hypothetical protein KatS3mg010_1346 [Acidimicrobiia bacterium]|nr:MAG: hypothetical protein KatS3mg010_1346 [Acidimicrobiia bacterium]